MLIMGFGPHTYPEETMIARILIITSLVVPWIPSEVSAKKRARKDLAPTQVREGLYLPYPLKRIFRGFAECSDGHFRHRAIDIGGVGKNGGLGTPIRSMVKAKITRIGTPAMNSQRYGVYDKRRGKTTRNGRSYTRSGRVKGYGRVYYFTRKQGKWRTGVLIETVGVGKALKGHKIRYMHLAALHPDLEVGDVVEAGQEIGLMGGTGVQQSAPHVHIDAANTDGEKIDIEVLFERRKKSKICERAKEDEGRVTRVQWNLDRCGVSEKIRNFHSGQYRTHEQKVFIPKGDSVVFRLDRLDGRWSPRMRVKDERGRVLYDGQQQARGTKSALIKKIVHGKNGRKAALRVLAERDITLRLAISQWPKNDSIKPPLDARYKLIAKSKCKKAKP